MDVDVEVAAVAVVDDAAAVAAAGDDRSHRVVSCYCRAWDVAETPGCCRGCRRSCIRSDSELWTLRCRWADTLRGQALSGSAPPPR